MPQNIFNDIQNQKYTYTQTQPKLQVQPYHYLTDCGSINLFHCNNYSAHFSIPVPNISGVKVILDELGSIIGRSLRPKPKLA